MYCKYIYSARIPWVDARGADGRSRGTFRPALQEPGQAAPMFAAVTVGPDPGIGLDVLGVHPSRSIRAQSVAGGSGHPAGASVDLYWEYIDSDFSYAALELFWAGARGRVRAG